MKALLVGFLAVLAAQPMPGVSRETLALLDRSPAVASPLSGYLTVGAFFLSSGQLDRAKQIYAYGLLHAPDDPRFLAPLAAVEERLGHREYAREYALACLAYAPGHPTAQEVLMRLGPAPAPSPAASPSAARSPAGSPASSPSPLASPASPAASPAPPLSASSGKPSRDPGASPSPAAPASPVRLILPGTLKDLATAVGAKGPEELEAIGRPPKLDPALKGDKLHALSVLKAIDAALKMYKLNHRKEEVKELDLKKLVLDKVLPKDLDLSGYPPMKLADGKLSMEGFGAMDAIETELAPYREGLEKAERHREKGLLSEAHSTLVELAGKFPEDPELLERLLRVQLELNLDFPAAESARKLFLARPAEPRHLWTLAVLYFRSRRPDQARMVAKLVPKVYQETYYTPAARALVALVDSGVSPDAIAKIVAEREAAAALPEPSGSPAASPSPSPK